MNIKSNKSEIVRYLLDQTSKRVGREINALVIHCTATKPGVVCNVDVIDRMHLQRGFKRQPSGRICGYHFVILRDGTIQIGRALSEIGAHVSGNNSKTIGIVYEGGLDMNGKGSDTRTPEQKESLIWLLSQLAVRFPGVKILGHRDYSPDLNGNGIIEKQEWIKECPCFDAVKEYRNI